MNFEKYEQVRIIAVDPKLDWAGDRKGGGLKGEDLVWYLRERIIGDKIRVVVGEWGRGTGLISNYYITKFQQKMLLNFYKNNNLEGSSKFSLNRGKYTYNDVFFFYSFMGITVLQKK